MNVFNGIGRLTADPELKSTPSGLSVANFTIAIDRKFKNQAGEREADFINCVAWRQTAEFIAKYFHKGQRIGVTGNVQVRKWQDKNGDNRYSTEIVVEQAYFCEKSGQGSSNYSDSYVPPANDFPQEFTAAAGEDLPFGL